MKRSFCVLLMVMAVCGVVNAGTPVFDVTNLITAIENGYTLYEQLLTSYNNLKNAYDQLEQNIKSFSSMDIRELDMKDPLGSWRKIMTYANRQMNYLNNIERVINTPNVRIGSASYSLNDLYNGGIRGAVSLPIDMLGNAVQFVAVDPFERELTLEQKAAFHSKYGMSPGNYIRYNQFGSAIKEKAIELKVFRSIFGESAEEDALMIQQIMDDGMSDGSVNGLLQTMNGLMVKLLQGISIGTEATLLSAEIVAGKASQDQESVRMDLPPGLEIIDGGAVANMMASPVDVSNYVYKNGFSRDEYRQGWDYDPLR